MPCLDEVGAVGLCVEEARAVLAAAGLPGEVVLADNGSSDGSAAAAARVGARVVRESRRGYGRAVLAGVRAARADVVVIADADSSYDLSHLPELVRPVLDGSADLVLGQRLTTAEPSSMPLLHRYVGTPVLSYLISRVCGMELPRDSQTGFRAFDRRALLALDLDGDGMEFASEMLIKAARARLRIAEVDVGYRVRIGRSKLRPLADGWRHLRLIGALSGQ
jgi:glycosyltransferase involved in cell wall biosynthesis